MKKMNKKGFTLIELLAVIVILGLLMAIAIPSVTRYITQSRRKTLVNTISNYMSALTTDVNNMDYHFTDGKIYAVPITCIAVERGGTDPFGIWNTYDTNWAYVLVQYDEASSSYTYGFTFKDSAGYGLIPTVSKEISSSNGDEISTINGKTLKSKLTTGDAVDYSATWSGFTVVADDESTEADEATKVQVLEAKGTTDHKTTCIQVEA